MMQILRSPHRRSAMTRRSLCPLALLVLCLTLGATRADAQTPAQDSSVDVEIGKTYHFRASDFTGLRELITLSLESLPRGTVTDHRGRLIETDELGATNPQGKVFFFGDLVDDEGPRYTPPADAISIATGYTSFIFNFRESVNEVAVTTMAIMTINLVGASTQTAATGAPTIAATDTHRISASIAGVTDPNGVDVGTLSWQWQQADAPASGVPATSAYIDIPGATSSSLFAPTAAQLSRYVRACVSFKDQFSMPASEGPLCSADAHQVTQLPPPDIRLRLRLFLEGPLR